MSIKDTIYRNRAGEAGSFRFDAKVAEVFGDMIHRSVPGYGLVVSMIGQLTRRYVQAGTRIHDLGCSLGAATLAIRATIGARDVRVIATDSSPDMIARCRELLDEQDSQVPVDVVCGDIRDTDLTGSSVVVLNFTLQFLDPKERETLLQKIHRGLVDGGVLVLSEKIRFEDPGEQRCQDVWHEDFKRLHGYSDLEIARKRSALEKVLEPETEAIHHERLRAAGFGRVTRWFQCFGFCSYLAEK